MSNLSIIIIGAGKGTRMKSSVSKVLHKIGNLEMINHIIKTAQKLNPVEICFVGSEDNIEEIKSVIPTNIKTTVQKERIGTANAVKIGFDALSNKNTNILVMYGDVPLISFETYEKLIDLLDNSNASIVDLGFHTKDIQNKYGRLIINNDDLEQIIEYKDATQEIKEITLCNSGILSIKNGILDNLLSQVKNDNASKEYYLTDIIKIARNENKMCKYVVGNEEEVMGVNSKIELSIAENIFQNIKRKEFMEKGVTLVDPSSVYFSYDTEIENDVVIEPNVVFLNGVKVNSNVVIHSFSYLEGCIIESGVSIGPFARIRPDSLLKKDSKIGNFVEIKKSTIGENTKVNHLSYIGNTTIGDKTNIGAGSITCNYDGYKKFDTLIGDNCFIGSNTTMIAPLKIEDNSIIGAGSVITKDISKNTLSISRSEQKNLKDKAISYRKKRENS